jgi:hypothetical protein
MYSIVLRAYPIQNTFEHPDAVVPSVTTLTRSDWQEQKGMTVRKHSFVFIMFNQ